MIKPSAGRIRIAAALLLLGPGSGCSVSDLEAGSDVTSPTFRPLPRVTTVVPTMAPTVTIVAKKYKNCAALTKVLPHGVGKPGASDKVGRGVDPVTDFFVHKELYKLNKHLDRDGDGIACEKL